MVPVRRRVFVDLRAEEVYQPTSCNATSGTSGSTALCTPPLISWTTTRLTRSVAAGWRSCRRSLGIKPVGRPRSSSFKSFSQSARSSLWKLPARCDALGWSNVLAERVAFCAFARSCACLPVSVWSTHAKHIFDNLVEAGACAFWEYLSVTPRSAGYETRGVFLFSRRAVFGQFLPRPAELADSVNRSRCLGKQSANEHLHQCHVPQRACGTHCRREGLPSSPS